MRNYRRDTPQGGLTANQIIFFFFFSKAIESRTTEYSAFQESWSGLWESLIKINLETKLLNSWESWKVNGITRKVG